MILIKSNYFRIKIYFKILGVSKSKQTKPKQSITEKKINMFHIYFFDVGICN